MMKCEEDLAAFYRGRVMEEGLGLGPAPERGKGRRERTARADFLAGIAALALAGACACACALPSPSGAYFAAAARSIASIRVDGRRTQDFLRALGSPFSASRAGFPGSR